MVDVLITLILISGALFVTGIIAVAVFFDGREKRELAREKMKHIEYMKTLHQVEAYKGDGKDND